MIIAWLGEKFRYACFKIPLIPRNILAYSKTKLSAVDLSGSEFITIGETDLRFAEFSIALEINGESEGRRHSKDLLDISRIARLHRCKISLRTRSATLLWRMCFRQTEIGYEGFYSARNNRYFNLVRRRGILKPNFTDETFHIFTSIPFAAITILFSISRHFVPFIPFSFSKNELVSHLHGGPLFSIENKS